MKKISRIIFITMSIICMMSVSIMAENELQVFDKYGFRINEDISKNNSRSSYSSLSNSEWEVIEE